ncbi:unnamed protein product [Calicophoron daubneyi]|uniref:Uncharacterized protein n=1 Tax=Calicophoron daubneyi TaxID=300641 RepID=A0AAV2SZL3_CALDB
MAATRSLQSLSKFTVLLAISVLFLLVEGRNEADDNDDEFYEPVRVRRGGTYTSRRTLHLRGKGLGGVNLHGRRKSERNYQEGLGELGDLMK